MKYFNFGKITKITFFSILFLTFISTLNAQTQTTSPSSDEMQNRVTQLEAQVQMMKAEIENLKKSLQPIAKKEGETVVVENKTETNVAENKTINKPETVSVANAKTAEVPKTQDKKNLGVDLGSVRLTPYGTIFFNAFGNSSGTNNTDVPLFATITGAGNASASGRQTRFGVRVEGAKVGRANLKAVLEADFYGGFPAVGIGENFGVVRLRLANARLDWEKTSVTIGQDWMIFAPVNPTSLAAAAIPQMAAAGNNWARLPQIKIERKLNKNFTLAGAILAPQTGDFQANAAFFLQPTSGASAKTPFFQSRIAFADTKFFGTKKAGSIGFSAHYGRSRVFTGAAGNINNDLDSVGVALDWNFPLAATLTLSGEAFTGRNLGGFQAGVFQGYNNDFARQQNGNLVAGGVRAIGTRGGWTQLGFTPNILQNRLSLYSSIGIDDPTDEDLITVSRRNFRTQNVVYAVDLIYKFTPQFQLGTEFRRFQTRYLFTGERDANHINLGASYSF